MKCRILATTLLLLCLPAWLRAAERREDFLKAIASGSDRQVAAMLKRDPNLASVATNNGTSALLFAMYQQQPGIAQVILPHRKGDLTIFESAALGQEDRLRILLKQDPGVATAFSADGFTALHFASFFGQTASQELLIRAGAQLEVHSRNPLNATPLQSAAAARQLQSAGVLLEHGADPNCRGELGYTPLFEAAGSGQVQLAALLLHHGADLSLKGSDGKTALDVAVETHQAAIEAMLAKEMD